MAKSLPWHSSLGWLESLGGGGKKEKKSNDGPIMGLGWSINCSTAGGGRMDGREWRALGKNHLVESPSPAVGPILTFKLSTDPLQYSIVDHLKPLTPT